MTAFISVLQPPLPWQEFLPLQPLSPDLQPPCPLQEFCPLHACLSIAPEPDAAPSARARLVPLLVLLVVEAETTALEPARSPLTAAVISRDFTVFLVIGIFLSKWLGLGFR